MIRWWEQTPIWQRILIFGLAMILFVLGMHTGAWSSMDGSIAELDREIARLIQKNRDSFKSIRLLDNVEQEVGILREKLFPGIQDVPAKVAPQDFRRDVVDIGKRTGVSVRLWNPKPSLMKVEQAHGSLDIVVKVEGSFLSTVQFLNELLQLSWIQTVNPLVLVRKQVDGSASLVTTDFTIKEVTSENILQTKELLKT